MTTATQTDPLSWVDTDLPPMATREQLARAANIHVRSVDRALARGYLDCVRVGRAIRIPRTAVRAWFARELQGATR